MEKKLRELFETYGKVNSIFVKIDLTRKAPFAFVSFENNSDAKKAIEELSGRSGIGKDPF